MPAHLHSPEYRTYKHVEHWQPNDRILPPDELLDPDAKLYPLFLFCYLQTKKLYKQMPPRKDGHDAFTHPINVVLDLTRAKVDDVVTLCAGMLHDYVEEQVDLYKQEHSLHDDRHARQLDRQEIIFFQHLQGELSRFCEENQLPSQIAPEIIDVLKLLTHHKRHFYYKYISAIFSCRNPKTRERSLQVKLADRMHNILCIECFTEQERIYQCYKNLFILNNAKKLLWDTRGKRLFKGDARGELTPTEKLFKKCAKATYDAYLTICHLSIRDGLSELNSLLQLAFKKFAIEKAGLWEVTDIDAQEAHPMRLYHGIVRKYDARLLHQWKEFDTRKKEELDYCRKFFAAYHLTPTQLQQMIYYKDAYALKEVVAYLLYQQDYYISRFLCEDLSREGMIKR